jgi:hypothetical protein
MEWLKDAAEAAFWLAVGAATWLWFRFVADPAHAVLFLIVFLTAIARLWKTVLDVRIRRRELRRLVRP